MIQWLRLGVPNTEAQVQKIPGQGTKLPHARTRSLHAAAKEIWRVATKMEDPECYS